MPASPYREQDILRLSGNTAAGQTDEVVQSALAGRRLRVLAFAAQAGGTATNVTLNSKPSGAGVAISPLFALGINGITPPLPFNPHGHFQTAAGEGLSITTGAGATVGWALTLAVIGSAEGDAGIMLLLEDAQGTPLLLEDSTPLLLEAA